MDVRLTVIPGRCEEWPVWEKDGLWSVMCSAEDLDEAAELARYAMLDFLRRRTGWKVQELVMLLSLIGDTAVCQVVDPRRRCALRCGGRCLHWNFESETARFATLLQKARPGRSRVVI